MPQILERTDLTTRVQIGDDSQAVSLPNTLPILPLRNMVVFPGTVLPLNVGRPRSKALLEEVMPLTEKFIGAICQRDPEKEDPSNEELFDVGVACNILKLFRLPDGNQSIIVQGMIRFRVKKFTATDPFTSAEVEFLENVVDTGPETEALVNNVRQQAERVIDLSPNVPDEAKQVLANLPDPPAIADFLAANLQLEHEDKQALLEELSVTKRLQTIIAKLAQQLDVLELQNKISTEVRESIDKSQRQFFLREQLKAIRRELGEAEGGGDETSDLKKKLEEAGLPEIVTKETERELGRLETIPQASPEYGVIRTYLELIAELPWSKGSEEKIDLDIALKTLNADHHDLEKVKRRIIEYLAVRKLKPDAGGAILCFVGPPGVGKTSLGQSIAKATGRHFIRVALGGVRDESEIRGHRRTYIGSMPGRIIAELRKAGTNNPVMMLDEIDKLGNDFRGDPASALLEVLDPAQNHTFTDHYLDLPFDLSKVLFIATANTMDPVPGPLRDRMEVIEIPGYTSTDKLHIARQYLVPRQLTSNGLKKGQARFGDPALREIIEYYTREAGVRSLERNIGSVVRTIAAKVVRTMEADGDGKVGSTTVTPDFVHDVLGPRQFEREVANRTSVPGVATGLAYTPVGGEILFIEASRVPGKGGITLTGQIGDVMRESATAAFTLIRSRAKELGIDGDLLANSEIHVHVPAGAVPKDGPSAGVAMVTALASLMMNRPVRHDVAMTGEITLRGLVLPIGGLKEKSLAALRAGIKHVIIPKRNAKDLVDLPEEVAMGLTFHEAETVDDVLRVALRAGREGKADKIAKTPVKKRKKARARA